VKWPLKLLETLFFSLNPQKIILQYSIPIKIFYFVSAIKKLKKSGTSEIQKLKCEHFAGSRNSI
jgi:hypothetical protein